VLERKGLYETETPQIPQSCDGVLGRNVAMAVVERITVHQVQDPIVKASILRYYIKVRKGYLLLSNTKEVIGGPYLKSHILS
jgi:hypothetical protein